MPILTKRLDEERKAASKLGQLVARWVLSEIKSQVNPLENQGFKGTWVASKEKPIRIKFFSVEHPMAKEDSGVIDTISVSGRLAMSITGEVNFIDANRPANMPSDALVEMSKNVVFSMNSGGFDCYGRFVINGAKVGIDGDATFTSNESDASFSEGTKIVIDDRVLVYRSGALGGDFPQEAKGQIPTTSTNTKEGLGEQVPLCITDPKEMEIAILDDSFALNGKRIDSPIFVKELVSLLGKPSRETSRYSTISTWDDLGIYVFSDPKSGKVKAFTVSLNKESSDFSPKKVFTGRIIVNGTRITPESTIDEINAAKRGQPFKKSMIPYAWNADYLNKSIFIKMAASPDNGFEYIQYCIKE
jgi:hypothetical protein